MRGRKGGVQVAAADAAEVDFDVDVVGAEGLRGEFVETEVGPGFGWGWVLVVFGGGVRGVPEKAA